MKYFELILALLSAVTKKQGIRSLIGSVTIITTLIIHGFMGFVFYLLNYKKNVLHLELLIMCVMVGVLYYFIFNVIHNIAISRYEKITLYQKGIKTWVSVITIFFSIPLAVFLILFNLQNVLGVDVVYEIFFRNR